MGKASLEKATAYSTASDILSWELRRRIERNPSYSLRAFARDLGLAPSSLSEVMKGKYSLSPGTGAAIAVRLGYQGDELAHFSDVVAASQNQKPSIRQAAVAAMRNRRLGRFFYDLEVTAFQPIARWYHLVILEFLKFKPVTPKAAEIATRLGLPLRTVKSALRKLLEMGLVEVAGDEYKPVHAAIATGDLQRAAFVRRFHSDMIAQGRRALDEQTFNECDFQSLVIAIDTQNLPAFQARVRAFQRELAAEFSASERRNDVFACCIQLFRIGSKPL